MEQPNENNDQITPNGPQPSGNDFPKESADPTPSSQNVPASPTSWAPQPIANSPAGGVPPSIAQNVQPNLVETPPDTLNQPAADSLRQPPLKKSRKRLYIVLASFLVVLGLSMGAVFGYYIPNKPENVYRTGVKRSGVVLDKMIDKSTEKEKLEQIKKSEMDGSIEWTYQGSSFKGSFNVKLDPNQSDSKFDLVFNEAGKPEQTFGLKLMSLLQKDKRFSDTYFQLTGIKALEVDSYAPGLSEYDGKWIAVEADFLESLGSGFLPPDEQKNKENISSEEVTELLRTISDVNNEYLFSTDPSKAVLENREYLGKEKTAEGITAHHYKVGVNNANSISYCKALSERILSLPITKKIANADDVEIKKQKDDAIKSCDDGGKNIKPEDTFEMWIDSKYKVIHKIRIYDEKNKKDGYTDIGQIYTGGDKLSFFVLYHKDENNLNIKFTVDVDIKANNSKTEFTAKQEGNDSFDGKGTFSAKPYTGELKVEPPAGAIPIKDILARYGFDPTYLSGISAGQQQKSGDAKRKSDINAIYTALEVYFAENGYYPSLEELNNNNFRSTNMRSLSDDALIPPGGANPSLAAAPSTNQYGYSASGCKSAGKQCQSYTLNALLETGEKYTKANLN